MSFDLQDSIDAYLEGEATPEMMESLDRALVADEEVRVQFLKSANLITELHLVLSKDESVQELPPISVPQAVTNFNWLALAAAVVILLGALLIVMRPPTENVVGEFSATSLVLVEGKAQTGGGNLKIGDRCEAPTQLMVSDDESAVFNYPDGTSVSLAGGAALRMEVGSENKMLFLERGTLLADVQPQPAGREMITETVNAKITVLGTRYQIVTTILEDELTVEHGRVRLFEKQTGHTQIAETGESYRIVGIAKKEPISDAPAALEEPRPAQFPAENYQIGEWWFTEDFEKTFLQDLWLARGQEDKYEYEYKGDEPHAAIVKTVARKGRLKNVLNLSRPLKTDVPVRFRTRRTTEWESFRLIYDIRSVGEETLNLSPYRLRLPPGTAEEVVFQMEGPDPLTTSDSWHREEFQFHRFWAGKEWQVEVRRYLDDRHLSTVRLQIEAIPTVQFELNSGACQLDFITIRQLLPDIADPQTPTQK